MKMLICDLCEKQFDIAGTETFIITVMVPEGYHEDNEPRTLDVCSPRCLGHLASFLTGDPVEEPSPDQAELPLEPQDGARPYLGAFEGEVTVR